MSNLSGPLPTTSGLALPNVLRKPPGELWTLAHRVPGSSCAFLTSRTMLKTAANLQTQPVLVSVLQSELPEGSQLAELASRLVATIMEACSRPVEDVHILLEPPAAGRIAFRRKIVTSTGTHSSTRASAFQALQRHKGDRAGYARQYGEERNERGRRAGERIAESWPMVESRLPWQGKGSFGVGRQLTRGWLRFFLGCCRTRADRQGGLGMAAGNRFCGARRTRTEP